MKRNVLKWGLLGCLAGILVSCQPDMKTRVAFDGSAGTYNGSEGLATAFVFTYTYPEKSTVPSRVKITGPTGWNEDGVDEITSDFTHEGSGKKLHHLGYSTSGSPNGIFKLEATVEGVDFSLTTSVDASVILPHPTGIHVSATTDTVAVNWSRVPGASAYFVCVLERVGEVTITTYTWGCETTTSTSVLIIPFEKLVSGNQYIANVSAWSADLTRGGELNLPAQVNASETEFSFALP
jgi:hypothetical protein